MARLKCAECGASVGRAEVVCRRCGRSLLEDGSVVEVPASENPASENPASENTLTSISPAESIAVQSSPAHSSPAQSSTDRCPHCGAEVPDPRNLVCIECMKELKPAAPAAPPPASSRPDGVDPYATTYERSGPRLQLSFHFGVVELEVGQEMMLGRDAPDQRLAPLHGMNNVSRQHATIGLSTRGGWVRDEHSTNGTYVNGSPVAAGEMVDLAEGAELRLASNVRADVRLYRPGEAGNG